MRLFRFIRMLWRLIGTNPANMLRTNKDYKELGITPQEGRAWSGSGNQWFYNHEILENGKGIIGRQIYINQNKFLQLAGVIIGLMTMVLTLIILIRM